MKSETVVQNYFQFAREAATTLLLAVLFLVTGCSNGDYSPRVELAPPPPGLIHPQAYGPAIPYEVAVLQSIAKIQPASGGHEMFGPSPQACSVRTAFTQGKSHFDWGAHSFGQQDHELSFSRNYSSSNAPGMMIRLNIALPSPVKKRDCH